MNRSSLTLNIYDGDILLHVTHKHLSLILKTKSHPEDFVTCLGPKNGKMVPLVDETLLGEVEMTLLDSKHNRIIYHGIGKACGIEYGGDQMKLMDA